jgi:hypothetical protein
MGANSNIQNRQKSISSGQSERIPPDRENDFSGRNLLPGKALRRGGQGGLRRLRRSERDAQRDGRTAVEADDLDAAVAIAARVPQARPAGAIEIRPSAKYR